MANKSFAASADAREKAAFDTASPTADNDVEPFPARDVMVPLSLRARLAPQTTPSRRRKAAAG